LQARLARAALLQWHSERARLPVAMPVPALVVRAASVAQVALAAAVRVAVRVAAAVRVALAEFALREREAAKRRARQTLARTESTPQAVPTRNQTRAWRRLSRALPECAIEHRPGLPSSGPKPGF
jgi:hypothetical protein